MKILSWNIWKGNRFEEVIREIKNLNPDVACLQEIKVDTTNQAEEIAKQLGYQVAYCQTFTTDRHTPSFSIGNAILSKSNLENVECIPLSTLSDYKNDSVTEPRGALKATVQDLTLICSHLGTAQHESSSLQLKQLSKLLSITEDNKCILAGDFNSQPESEVIKKIEEVMTNTNSSSTPTIKEEKNGQIRQERIDYVFLSKDLKFKDFKIIPTQASDHSMLTLEV